MRLFLQPDVILQSMQGWPVLSRDNVRVVHRLSVDEALALTFLGATGSVSSADRGRNDEVLYRVQLQCSSLGLSTHVQGVSAIRSLEMASKPGMRGRNRKVFDNLEAVEVQFLSPRCQDDAQAPRRRLTINVVKRA